MEVDEADGQHRGDDQRKKENQGSLTYAILVNSRRSDMIVIAHSDKKKYLFSFCPLLLLIRYWV